jgi:outer membrane immunogenic protein
MRNKLISSIAGTAFSFAASGFAFAADLNKPVYKASPPPPPAPVYSWTGCYLGGNVGGAWQHNSTFDAVVDFDTGGASGNGVIGGAQVGCDYQFANNWVVGVRGMLDWTDVNSSHRYLGGGSSADETLGIKTRWVDTLTGRIGYTVWPQTLLYFQGGGAWARIDYSDVDPAVPYAGQANATRSGWTVGGGFEYAFLPNWSLFVEYDYIDLGNRNEQLTYGCGSICVFPNYIFPNPYTFTVSHNISEVLFGINYRFGWLAAGH